MENKFFTFINPYLTYIDNGHFFRKPFSWIYSAIAIINLIMPLYFFYLAVDNGIFKTEGKIVIVFIIVWLIITLVSWISFQLWWQRGKSVRITSKSGDDFTAIPVISHYIQTIGEWIGTWIGIVGFSVALLSTLFLGNNADYFIYQLGIKYIGTGAFNIISMPLIGFFIIIFFRFIAEQFRTLAAIANNSKKED